MAGSMSRADLVQSLKESLMDAAASFTAAADADFVRHLDVAAADMHRVRPRTLVGDVTIEAGVDDYAAPADIVRYKSALWGAVPRAKPWESSWPGLLPTVRLIDGNRLSFRPAPDARQIALLGAEFRFYYVAKHTIGQEAANTTIAAVDRPLLVLRAQAEAMRELAIRDSVRPVQIRDGFSGQAKNGNPAALHAMLLAEWLMNAR